MTAAQKQSSTISGKREKERRKLRISLEMTHNTYSDDRKNKLPEDLLEPINSCA